jgi:hypothetical protein
MLELGDGKHISFEVAGSHKVEWNVLLSHCFHEELMSIADAVLAVALASIEL